MTQKRKFQETAAQQITADDDKKTPPHASVSSSKTTTTATTTSNDNNNKTAYLDYVDDYSPQRVRHRYVQGFYVCDEARELYSDREIKSLANLCNMWFSKQAAISRAKQLQYKLQQISQHVNNNNHHHHHHSMNEEEQNSDVRQAKRQRRSRWGIVP